MDTSNRLSLTTTVARQTPRTEFGSVLKTAVQNVAQTTGALLGAMPGGGIISAAVRNVAALTSSPTAVAATGITSVNAGGNATAQAVASTTGGVPQELNGLVSQMRAEADRSTLMQMQMQQESRDYNAVSNVLKVRHESAKAAINNIR